MGFRHPLHTFVHRKCMLIYNSLCTKVHKDEVRNEIPKKIIFCCYLSVTHTLSLSRLADTNMHFALSPSRSHANACTHSRWRHCCLKQIQDLVCRVQGVGFGVGDLGFKPPLNSHSYAKLCTYLHELQVETLLHELGHVFHALCGKPGYSIQVSLSTVYIHLCVCVCVRVNTYMYIYTHIYV